MADQAEQQDPEAETTTETTTAAPLEQQVQDMAKRIKELNKENADRRKKLEAFEKEKAEKDAASLTDLERAKAELAKVAPELEQLRKEKQALLLQSKFEKTARELKMDFANDKAQEDAFKLLDADAVGEDGEGMKDALTALQKDRPYLFTKLEAPETDARQKGKTSTEITSADLLEQKRREYGSL